MEIRTSEAEILVIEIRRGFKYLSIYWYPTYNNYMVYYDNDVDEDPIVMERLDSEEAYKYFNQYRATIN
jgi:hypothetical protein